MKIIQKVPLSSYEDFYAKRFEFKLCNGSVEPQDRVAAADRKCAKAEDEDPHALENGVK